MAGIIESKRGRSVGMEPEDQVAFGRKLTDAAARHQLTLEAVISASTLSRPAVTRRMAGEGSPHIKVWAFVALCDAVKLNPTNTAKALGVTLTQLDVTRSRGTVSHRQLAPEQDGHMGLALDVLVERVLEERISQRVDAYLDRVLAGR